jgi:glycosyltransferase involved in cell wall biosynthesis
VSNVDLTLALPAYNEARNLEAVLEASTSALERIGLTWELLVIDNCSTDDTAQLADAFAEHHPGVRVIRHDRNRQYSGSCATAIDEAGGDRVAIMDSDGQADPADLSVFLERLDRGANLVFGWRRERDDPPARLAMSYVFNLMGKWHLRFPFHDLNCGFRMFDRRFVEVAQINHEVNLVNPELYVRARLAGLAMDEVAITHSARIGGKSSHEFRHSLRIFWTVNRYLSDLARDLRAGVQAARIDH